MPGVTGMKETENNADGEAKTIKGVLILSLVVVIIAVVLGGALLVHNHCSGCTREELMTNPRKCLSHLENDKITVIKVKNLTVDKEGDGYLLLVISGKIIHGGHPINIDSALVSDNIVVPVIVVKYNASSIVMLVNENDIVITNNTYLGDIKSNLEGRIASIIPLSESEGCQWGYIIVVSEMVSISIALIIIIFDSIINRDPS